MNLVNLTPHVVRLLVGDGEIVVESSGVARVATFETEVGSLDGGVPLVEISFGEPVGLPEAVDGTTIIVSALVAAAARRPDVVSPGRLARDAQGRVTGCAALVRYPA